MSVVEEEGDNKDEERGEALRPNRCRSLSLATVMKRATVTVMLVLLLLVKEGQGKSCGRRVKFLNATTTMELLTSPSYPNDYESNEHCKWVVSATLPGHVVQLETVASDLVNWDGGQCEDYLAVYDGLDDRKPLLRKWCGSEKAVVKSNGKAMLVVFHTDQHLTSSGFAIKYYAMRKYSSKCDPDRTVVLETTINPIFVDLPNFTGLRDVTIERVQCRFLFTSSRPDVGQVIKLQFHSAMKCSDGNFTVYDGGNETSPKILSWCYGSQPFDLLTTSRPQALVTFTLLRPDVNWHVLRLRVVSRSRHSGCNDYSVPTLQVSSLATYVSFPYTTTVQGSGACSLRLWAKGRYQTLRLDVVTSSSAGSAVPCGDEGITFYDGYSLATEAKLLGEGCQTTTVHSSTHHLLVTPGAAFPVNRPVVVRVVALDYPCNNNTQSFEADSDRINTLPSLASDIASFPNDAQCHYLLTALHSSDAVQVEVQGRMVDRYAAFCDGDYLVFYDGDTSTAPELGRWCGAQQRRLTVTSTGPHLLVKVISDHHDNQFDGFSLDYYSVPSSGRCERRMVLMVNHSSQVLTSPNYPFYYPINSYCEWLLEAEEGEVIRVEVVQSEMEGDCSDMVRVYDGEEKKLETSLGRWCARETPQFLSTGRHLLLIFTADDRWNSGGFELRFFTPRTESTSQASVWAIVGGLLAAIIIIAIVVIAVVLYMRHWRREQRKI